MKLPKLPTVLFLGARRLRRIARGAVEGPRGTRRQAACLQEPQLRAARLAALERNGLNLSGQDAHRKRSGHLSLFTHFTAGLPDPLSALQVL